MHTPEPPALAKTVSAKKYKTPQQHAHMHLTPTRRIYASAAVHVAEPAPMQQYMCTLNLDKPLPYTYPRQTATSYTDTIQHNPFRNETSSPIRLGTSPAGVEGQTPKKIGQRGTDAVMTQKRLRCSQIPRMRSSMLNTVTPFEKVRCSLNSTMNTPMRYVATKKRA